MKRFLLATTLVCTLFELGCSGPGDDPRSRSFKPPAWKHLSTATNDLKAPNSGDQQTASAVFDVDRDGVNDFMITERSAAPAVVWYRYVDGAWLQYVVEEEPLRIEAGSAVTDIDQDGDEDVVFGGDSRSNQVWWWENPYPDFAVDKSWRRHLIKDSGGNKHHDQMFGDFDGDGRQELLFWNQGDRHLVMARIPSPPAKKPWKLKTIYAYGADSEPLQRGEYPGWKGTNEHEGLAQADINGDGKIDIVGGGRWFEHIEGDVFRTHVIDETYAFSRAAAGQLIEGGRPEVVLVVGDGAAPLVLYQWSQDAWVSTVLMAEVRDGHSMETVDFDGDGNLDIFLAEMRLGANPDAKVWLLMGDGEGGFEQLELLNGYGLHESRMVDLDGDGDLDILGKPYTWEAPRLDLWINQGS